LFALASSALSRPAFAQDDDAPPGFVASEQVEEEGSASATTTQADGSTTTTTVVKADAEAAPQSASAGAPILDDAAATEDAPPADVPADVNTARKAELRRVQNSWHGPAGGIHIVDAGSGAPLSVRLQLAADMFSTSDYLHQGDINDYFGGTLSLGVSVMEHLEVYASIHSHANGNTEDSPQLLQVLGDLTIGGKGYAAVTPWLTAGADLRLAFLNSIGTVGPILKSTSVGLRGLLSADLRRLEKPVPLIARGSIDYYLDNSGLLVEDVEVARYNSLPADMRDEFASEDSHLIRRVERFALTVNRMDMLTFGLGLELPLLAHGTPEEGWFIHPITEWTVGVPVNRQGYSCLLVATNTGRDQPDGCLDVEGFAAMPSTLTFGARVFPPKVPLSVLLGFDIGLSGTSTFVRELAPNRPWAFLIALGYSVDEGPRPDGKPVIVERERVVVQAAPPLPRIDGAVVDKATNAGIAGAIITYADRGDLTAQATNANGRFVSYELPQGAAVRLALSHPDYEPGECSVVIPEGQAAAPVPASAPPPAQEVMPPPPPSMPGASNDGPTLNPYLYAERRPAAAPNGPAPAGTPLESAKVPLRCELKAKPRAGALRGEVVNEAGKPVTAAQVMITGASTHLLTSDADGAFALPQLIAGNYSVRVEADAYLLKIEGVDVAAQQQAVVRVVLIAKPKTAQVELTQEEVRIRSSVFFKLNSAELSEQSNALLTEVVDVLVRNPQVTSVEVQGHTDGQGTAAQNLQLSQERAEAVRSWLIEAGIASDRLTAKGYGDTRPLLPNITERARARNRRVQFIIR
jgi:outer membrane protein OmpA-like peptidoglycan-associated protein